MRRRLSVPLAAGGGTLFTFIVQALDGAGTARLQFTAPGFAPHTSTITLTPSGFILYYPSSITTTTFSSNTGLLVLPVRLNPDLTVAADPGSQSVRGGGSVNVPIASSNPAVGTIVDFAHAPIDHLTFTGGVSSASPQFAPTGGGTAVITLETPPGFSTPATQQQIPATVTAPPITVPDATVGKDLQVGVLGQLGAPAPASGIDVTITSLDPARVLVSSSSTVAGAASLSVPLAAGGGTLFTFIVQALDGAGTARLQFTAPGFAPHTSTITLTPSGFILSYPSSITTTTFSSNTGLLVLPVRLNPDLTVAADPGSHSVRGGGSVNVPIASSNPAVGTIVDFAHAPIDHLTFTGGVSSASPQFAPTGGGTAVITLETPPGFSTPATQQQIPATVTAPPITVPDATVGKDLQVGVLGQLGAPAPASGIDVTITSLDPARVLVSSSSTVAGAASLSVPLAAGGGTLFTFIVQALDGAGTARLQFTAPGFAPHTSTITLTPSGFILSYPSSITTTTFSSNTGLVVMAVRLNPDLTRRRRRPALRARRGVRERADCELEPRGRDHRRLRARADRPFDLYGRREQRQPSIRADGWGHGGNHARDTAGLRHAGHSATDPGDGHRPGTDGGIERAPVRSDPTTTSPIEFFALFSEPVTGFTASDVRFAGSTVGGTWSRR